METIFRGQEFSSYEKFLQALEELQAKTFSCFSIKNSEKAENSNQRRKYKVPIELVIARAQYVCSHFGTVRKRGDQKVEKDGCRKRIYRTHRLGCEASFVITFDDRRKTLVITHCNLSHNHPTTYATYMQERKSKALTDDEMNTLKDIITELNPDNTNLMTMINTKFNKSLCLKEVRTLKHRLMVSKSSPVFQTQGLSGLKKIIQRDNKEAEGVKTVPELKMKWKDVKSDIFALRTNCQKADADGSKTKKPMCNGEINGIESDLLLRDGVSGSVISPYSVSATVEEPIPGSSHSNSSTKDSDSDIEMVTHSGVENASKIPVKRKMLFDLSYASGIDNLTQEYLQSEIDKNRAVVEYLECKKEVLKLKKIKLLQDLNLR